MVISARKAEALRTNMSILSIRTNIQRFFIAFALIGILIGIHIGCKSPMALDQALHIWAVLTDVSVHFVEPRYGDFYPKSLPGALMAEFVGLRSSGCRPTSERQQLWIITFGLVGLGCP